MDDSMLTELLEETILMAEEDGSTATADCFVSFVQEMLPPDVLNALEEINGGDREFLRVMWEDEILPHSAAAKAAGRAAAGADAATTAADEELLEDGCCLVCERVTKLTRHHLFPREMHKRLMKEESFTPAELNTTLLCCRMCHNAIHSLFENDQLARHYYSLDLLLADERFFKYAKWASKQKARRR